ncbi:hypothetical protein [Streptomyces sp. SID3343]|uniref:hypothetical protein n=1 Tax=Streptomyces sp. SID3343 TaxID=2690260 RepID=UPI00136DF640|nr:hypothetical protein [Streptomyces sp. SID3343]MYW06685.1 hypothetical protein [Streptomyces sp. SID3343]
MRRYRQHVLVYVVVVLAVVAATRLLNAGGSAEQTPVTDPVTGTRMDPSDVAERCARSNMICTAVASKKASHK